MCGILGVFGSTNSDQWIKSGIEKIKFRGPDNQSILNFDNILTLASARLAMTDPLPRSNQPMTDKTSGDAIVFNGEIYNYESLSFDHLNGISLKTESDTEVLLLLMQKYGINAIKYLQGMYAFAYYNAKNCSLILARDKLGKKPLYYRILENKIYFSSCIDTLSDLSSPVTISNKSLYQYLSLGYLLDDETIDSKVKSIMPGSQLVVSFRNSKIVIEKSKSTNQTSELDVDNENLREIIYNSVSVRVNGHNSAALSLSGGIDSSIIAQVLSDKHYPVVCYSASWPDSDKTRYNTDSDVAKSISKILNLEYHQIDIFSASDLLENLDNFLVAMQEPNNNPSGLSMFNLYSKIADDGHRLVLTGDGADEIFGGYARYDKTLKIANFPSSHSEYAAKFLLNQLADSRNLFWKTLITQISPKNEVGWLYWHWVFTPKEINDLFGKNLNQSFANPFLIQPIKAISSIEPNRSLVDSIMQLDHEVWLNMESNRKLDRISMNFSIEARSPFQDEKVIQVANSLMRGIKTDLLGKTLLKNAFPELNNLGTRTDKAGFTSPIGHWLRKNVGLVKVSLDHLATVGIIDKDKIEILKSYPNSKNYRKLMQLWTLIVLSRWLLLKNVTFEKNDWD